VSLLGVGEAICPSGATGIRLKIAVLLRFLLHPRAAQAPCLPSLKAAPCYVWARFLDNRHSYHQGSTWFDTKDFS
jgi:hypothetical protein